MTSPTTVEGLSEPVVATARPQFWPREVVLGLLPLLIGSQLLISVMYLPSGLHGLAVFRTLYTSGFMLRTHHARYIHDSDALQHFSQQLVPLEGILNQPMDHPAYEAVVFAPLSLLRYRTGLLVFAGINVGILGLCAWFLWPSLDTLSQRWRPFPALLFLTFFPITYTLTRGADSILLLLLLCGAFVFLRKEEDFGAGVLVGLGLFKFQIVLPIAFLFFVWRRWRFGLGFGISAALTALASLLMVGINGAKQYASMLLGMSLNLRSDADAIRYSISPRTMLNLRGLLSVIFGRHLGHWWLQFLIIASSLAVLWVSTRCRPSLSLAIVAAALVSYHFNAPDACVLMIPIALGLSGKSKAIAIAAITALIIPMAAVLPLYGFLGAIPIAALFAFNLILERTSESPSVSVPSSFAALDLSESLS